jgi:hypothetical protein
MLHFDGDEAVVGLAADDIRNPALLGRQRDIAAVRLHDADVAVREHKSIFELQMINHGFLKVGSFNCTLEYNQSAGKFTEVPASLATERLTWE